jgi:predicted secreted hydrolase
VYFETLARGALGQGYASERALDVRANGWSLDGDAAPEPAMHLRARDGNDALDLTQVPEKAPAVHGRDGISQKGPCRGCASHYYSFTRLRSSGSVTRDGVRYSVTGISWMDHEYGSDELQPQQSGWDWFSIQLDDRREIMLYRLRQRDGSTTPQSSGSVVAADGSVRYVPLSGFHITSQSTWTSPHTHAVYPASWVVSVAGVRAPLRLTPIVADQELYDPSGTTYWEGAVDVRDANTGMLLGVGYVELTGYAAPVEL